MSQAPEKKMCRNCGTEKEVALFEVDSRCKTKHTNRCRECKNELDDKASRAYRRLRSRSEKIGTPIEVTKQEIRLLFEMFDGCCAYCGKRPETERQLTLEHIVPLSEGGRNTLANLIPACISCNSSKHNKPFITHFLENREKFPDENFSVVVHYISLLSGTKAEETLSEMLDDHADYHIKQIDEDFKKAGIS